MGGLPTYPQMVVIVIGGWIRHKRQGLQASRFVGKLSHFGQLTIQWLARLDNEIRETKGWFTKQPRPS